MKVVLTTKRTALGIGTCYESSILMILPPQHNHPKHSAVMTSRDTIACEKKIYSETFHDVCHVHRDCDVVHNDLSDDEDVK